MMGRLVLLRAVAAMILAVLTLPLLVSAMPGIPSAPNLKLPVVDKTNTLTSVQIADLSALVDRSLDSNDFKISVLVVPSLDNYPLDTYATRVAQVWGVNKGGARAGVLLLIVKDINQAKILASSDLTVNLTSDESDRIVNEVITPELSQDDYYQAVEKGMTSSIAVAQGKRDPNASIQWLSTTGNILGAVFSFNVLALLPLIWLMAILGRTKRLWLGGLAGALIGIGASYLNQWETWSYAVIGIVLLIGVGFDLLISRNYHQRLVAGKSPSWWAGGSWRIGSSV